MNKVLYIVIFIIIIFIVLIYWQSIGPKILPSSSWYWIKEQYRKFVISLSFTEEGKYGKYIKFANEKLEELREMAKKKIDEKIIEKSMTSFSEYLEKIEEMLGKNNTSTASSTKSIIDRIKEEKGRIEEELNMQ